LTRDLINFSFLLQQLTGGQASVPQEILDLSEQILSNVSKFQADITLKLTNRLAKMVMAAWGRANRPEGKKPGSVVDLSGAAGGLVSGGQ
jgi:hypothetical protein